MNFSGLIYVLELVATIAFSISGAMTAINKKVDMFGVIVLGAVSALGGGITRDLLMGDLPPAMFSDYRYVLTSVITSAAVFIVAYIFREFYFRSEKAVDGVNNIFDALGLGCFTVAGAKIAMENGFTTNGILVVCLAVVTGVGGGIIRDIMLGEIPLILKKRIYALASTAGGVMYYLSVYYGVGANKASAASVALVFVIRLIATVFKLDMPKIVRNVEEVKK